MKKAFVIIGIVGIALFLLGATGTFDEIIWGGGYTGGSGGILESDGDLKINGTATIDADCDVTGDVSGGTVTTASAAITGGSVTGITDLAIADGGTGSSTAEAAADALGVGATDSVTFGPVASGADDTTQGSITAYGDGTTGGGYVALYNGGTNDTTVDRWRFIPDSDLRIDRDNTEVLSVSASTGSFDFAVALADSEIASATDWNTAYTDRLKWDGGATGLTAATGRTSLALGSADSVTFGTLALGVDDTTAGTATIYGAAADTGGSLRLYNPANGDATTEFWSIDAGDGGLEFSKAGSDIIFYLNANVGQGMVINENLTVIDGITAGGGISSATGYLQLNGNATTGGGYAYFYNASGEDTDVIYWKVEADDQLKILAASTEIAAFDVDGMDITGILTVSGGTAATDTAGTAITLTAQDGGADGGTASSGQDGGEVTITSGDGSAAVTTDANGGSGGSVFIELGAGGAGDGGGSAGNTGVLQVGNSALTSGDSIQIYGIGDGANMIFLAPGGDDATSGNGEDAGAVLLGAGAGGTTTDVGADGGAGGTVYISGNLGGTEGSGGTPGAAGNVVLGFHPIVGSSVGKVGILNPAPAEALDVAGNVTYSGVMYSPPETLTADDTTPDVSGGNIFIVPGDWTAGHNITDFDGGTAGQQIVIVGGDSDCDVTDGGNLKLAGNWTATADSTLTLVYAGSAWYEVSRSAN